MTVKTWKTITKTISWLLMIGVAVYCGYAYGWPWAIAGFVGTWVSLIVLVILFGITWAAAAMFLPVPRWFARPLYLHWKNQLKAKHRANPIHPLVDFPLAVFMEVQLDREFEAGGWKGAQDALKKWLDDFPNRVGNMVESIAQMRGLKNVEQTAGVPGGREDQDTGKGPRESSSLHEGIHGHSSNL